MKKGLVFLLILSLYTAAGFCGGQEEVISEEASVLSGSVMVYTSMSRSVIEVVKAGFEADNNLYYRASAGDVCYYGDTLKGVTFAELQSQGF